MIASKIAAPFLTLAMAMVNAGTNKFALGLDAPEFDQLARSLALSSEQRAAWTPSSSDRGSLDAGGASEDEGGMHKSRSGGADGHHVSLHQGGPFDSRQERVLKSMWIQQLFKTRPPTRQPTRPPTGGLRTRPPTGRTRPPTRRPSSSPVILSSSPTPPPSVGPTAQPSAKPMSSSPSTSPSISPSVSPTSSPTSSPTASPSVSPSSSPSGSPSVKPSVSFKFTTNAELRTAIREYLSQGCPDDANCQAHSDYGDTIGDWDVSRVEDFSRLFVNNSYNSIPGAAAFNEPINWSTGSATRMSYMFLRATAFNQPLSLDTAKVTDMYSMFYGATAFNQPLSLDTAKVTSMGAMFYGATAFNQPLSFDTAEVRDMYRMFRGATAFNQPLSLDTAKVTDMGLMFGGATAFNQDLCHFGDNFSQFIDVRFMFQDSGCSNKNDPTSASGPWCAVTTCQ